MKFESSSLLKPEHESTRLPENDATRYAIIDPRGGWEALGFDTDANYRIFSHKTGTAHAIEANGLTESNICAKVGMQYCEDTFARKNILTGKKEIDWKSVRTLFAKACEKKGIVGPLMERQAGVYADENDLVVHFGDNVFLHDGTPVPCVNGKRAYIAGSSLGFDFATEILSVSESNQIEDAFNSFAFNSQRDRIASMGYTAQAFYANAIPTRPLLAIEADRASGKTTLLNFKADLLGPQVERRDSVPTGPQVRHAMKCQPRSLIIDEVEARRSVKRNWDDVQELFRTGFTNSEGVRNMTRIHNGVAQDFFAPPGGCVAGISLPAMNPATDSRTVRIQLGRLSKESTKNRSGLLGSGKQRENARALGRKFRRTLIARWPTMRDSLAFFYEALLKIGHESRFIDKWSPLLAGYWTFKSETAPTSSQIKELLETCGLLSIEPMTDDNDSERCLVVLLDARITVIKPGLQQTRENTTIGSTIKAMLTEGSTESANLGRQLERSGLRLLHDKTGMRLFVVGSSDHTTLKKMFKGSDWALGGWKAVLMRLPAAKCDSQRVDGMTRRGVSFKVPDSFLEGSDEVQSHQSDISANLELEHLV